MKEDCFAFKKDKDICKALNEVECKEGKSCPFYKTKERQSNSIRKAYIRLASLDRVSQKSIADKYCKGQYPWQEGK